MISAADQRYIRDYFAEKLSGDVTIDLVTARPSALLVPGREECMYCGETEKLLGEVAELSDRITLNVRDVRQEPDAAAELGVERVPAIIFRGAGRGTMRFFGIPAGNEFRNLIDGIVEVGTGQSELTPETRDALAALPEDIHLQVFVTPT